MPSKKKLVVGLFVLVWIILIAQHIYVHSGDFTSSETEKKQKTSVELPIPAGTYVVLWSNAAKRFTIKDDGTYIYEYLNKDGKTKSFENKWILTQINVQGILTPALNLQLTPAGYICYDDGRIWYRYQGKEYYYNKDFAKLPPYSADVEVYVFGETGLKFDGAVSVLGDKSYTKSVEGEIPAVFSVDNADIVSVSFQKKWRGDDELTVVIYDPQTKTILNSATTTASYGVVTLEAED